MLLEIATGQDARSYGQLQGSGTVEVKKVLSQRADTRQVAEWVEGRLIRHELPELTVASGQDWRRAG